jgi:transcriptional regulator with GAF, ATPase, and Fis domain
MKTNSDLNIIGTSPKFRDVLSKVAIVAPADCSVLLQGETGTGKEVVAQAIHNQSSRSSGPFVRVNCAAIPSGLLESELFGHERGAFTGAYTQTMGRFQLANHGTLLLDEIGDLPVELQPKLLRVLQEQELERLGSPQTIRIDVRVIASTNQDLEQMVVDRKFRADLFYRLNVFPIQIPALRDRPEDIEPLLTHFVRLYSQRMKKVIDEIPEGVLEILRGYDWPGNIRELQNFVERSVLMTMGNVLHTSVDELRSLTPRTAQLPVQTLASVERTHILDALRKAGWVIAGRRGAAARLGLPRTTFLSRMRKHGITREAAGAEGSGGNRWGAGAARSPEANSPEYALCRTSIS